MVLRTGFALVALFALVACGGSSGTEKYVVQEEAATADGEMLYLNNCAACHGTDGKLGTSGAFDLTTTKLNTIEIKEIVLKGRNGMPPFEQLIKDDSEIDAVVDFVESMKK